jgi:hypothetical protein
MYVGTLVRSRTLKRRPYIYIFCATRDLIPFTLFAYFTVSTTQHFLADVLQNYLPFSIFEEKPLFSFPLLYVRENAGKIMTESRL